MISADRQERKCLLASFKLSKCARMIWNLLEFPTATESRSFAASRLSRECAILPHNSLSSPGYGLRVYGLSGLGISPLSVVERCELEPSSGCSLRDPFWTIRDGSPTLVSW